VRRSRGFFTPARLAAAGLVLLGLVGFLLWATPTDSYIFLPNKTHAVEPLVDVEGGKPDDDGGGIYYVDVLVRKATLLERLWPGLRDGSTIVPASSVRPPGVSDEERRREELRAMDLSQDVAAAVALRELGYEVEANPIGVRVDTVDPSAPAFEQLERGDVILRVDGERVTTPPQLRRLIREREPGETVRLVVRRGGKQRQLEVRTIADDDGDPIIGVLVDQAARIRLPIDVDIDSGGVGGPSAGLAFALDVMEELGRDVDKGNRVAVTGSIGLDGSVGEIGGMKQKAIAVARSNADVFLVPSGDNAQEARRYADGVRVIPVRTFQQALRALATLPRNGQEA
jgi:Lon-like protease